MRHAFKTGCDIADALERLFPHGLADTVIAAIVTARMAEQIDAGEIDDLDDDTVGGQADRSPLCAALIRPLGAIGVAVKFDDV